MSAAGCVEGGEFRSQNGSSAEKQGKGAEMPSCALEHRELLCPLGRGSGSTPGPGQGGGLAGALADMAKTVWMEAKKNNRVKPAWMCQTCRLGEEDMYR